ncbi:hypothetical protein [Lyngbya confervoides]|uniref:PEP-CTERM protein-sorting domain-containing protein n=1 Tax=Lyngbya confervoides BDU141951 TaxID=1574623 RepID=A0ABD4T888_9CYAN|nr:hypothetical protein [Lyngbya confervoides]MCM1984664.1 hypothetical protein [Lyngbya confervoides BDU141951]
MSVLKFKTAPLLLSASVIAASGLSLSWRVNAAQLYLQDSGEAYQDSGFGVPYGSSLEETDLLETAAQGSETAGFNCDALLENSNPNSQLQEQPLSYLGPNLVASAGSFELAQFPPPSQLGSPGAIIDDNSMCAATPPIGGGGGGIPLYPLAGIPALVCATGICFGDDSSTPVPEPAAIPFVFSSLGIVGILARKRFLGSKGSDK